jgi:hypothetical protein
MKNCVLVRKICQKPHGHTIIVYRQSTRVEWVLCKFKTALLLWLDYQDNQQFFLEETPS